MPWSGAELVADGARGWRRRGGRVGCDRNGGIGSGVGDGHLRRWRGGAGGSGRVAIDGALAGARRGGRAHRGELAAGGGEFSSVRGGLFRLGASGGFGV